MKKDFSTAPELSREHLLDLTKKIPLKGIKERQLTPDQQEVVAVMKDLVFHFVSGKNLDDYQMAAHVGQLPPNTMAILGVFDWLNAFQPGNDCGYFVEDDLSCELVEVIGPDAANKKNITLKSLSSRFLLTGLTEEAMNQAEVTGEARIKLLTNALVARQLRIESTGSQVMAVSPGWGPVITARAV